MSKLTWDNEGERLFETGVSEVALYPFQTNGYTKGVAWNGVSSITDSPGGAESNKIYADNIEYLNLMSAETAGGTIEAYMAPDEFAECDGSVEIAPGVYAGQQNRKKFGLAYKTIDSELQDAYKGTTNCNSLVTLSNGFPKLIKGENEISFSGGITSVEVIPKWWTL